VRLLVRLVDDLLDVTRLATGKISLGRRPVDLAAVARRMVDALAATTPTRTLRCEANGSVWIEADEARLEQILGNLLGNAVKFTPAGGVVSLEARRESGELVVAVTDTGIGIAEADREAIFESFQQGARGPAKEEGTGLGLTLCRRIVELFGGRITLDSELGRGSRFEVRLPVTAYRPEAGGEVVAGSGGAILLVDDDRASLELMAAQLEATGVQLLRAHDGTMALELARTAAPAGIVLDILLPGIDGWDVLRELRQDPATSGIPVVVASGVDDRARGTELGAAAYLVKPFERDELVATLRRVGALAPEPTGGR
jgi:CheY-like chemotaxis protein/two-component sensor histidine kinase